MLRTIKRKLIVGILFLIFTIQASSFLFNYSQVTSILESELTFNAENCADPLFKSMDEAMRKYNGITDTSTVEEITESIDWSVKFVQLEKFKTILETQEKMKTIQYINLENISIGHSVEEKRGKPADPFLLELVDHTTTVSLQQENLFHIFVPIKYLGKQYGGFVFSFSNDRLIQERKKVFQISMGIFLFFFIAAAIMLPLFVNRVLTNPIKRVIHQMKEYAEGHFEHRLEIKERNEIGEIGLALNALIDSLQSAFRNISDVMGNVENGDLSQEVTVELKGDLDQLKNRINKSIAMLSQTMTQVESTSEFVNGGANELSKTAASLSTSTSAQASTLEEIAASMVEIGAQTKKNMQYSMEAQQISGETMNIVKKGNQQMEDMLTSMSEIETSSTNVSKIIKVIDEIAFQTNLLALNAAVEAARAGKYGKGFAVVAEEVRNLASRSAEAAKDTTELIETAIKEIKNGVENANKTERNLDDIIKSVERSNELVTKIAQSSQEQNQGITEINDGISQVNEIVQENSSIAEDTATSSQGLLEYSSHLQSIISQFKLMGSVTLTDPEDSTERLTPSSRSTQARQIAGLKQIPN